MATGRPTLYREDFPKRAAHLCELGATDADLARSFEVSIEAISDWKVKYPAFLQAIKSAKVDYDTKVERSLRERAMGYSVASTKIMQYEGEPVIVPCIEQYPPDTAAAIFWLKNRRPKEWRDKIDLEHSGSVDFAGVLQAARKRKA